jgi:hypothetical protein
MHLSVTDRDPELDPSQLWSLTASLDRCTNLQI